MTQTQLERLWQLVTKTIAIADVAESAIAHARLWATEIMMLSIHMPDAQRENLMEEAKRLCDNLSPQVALYTWLSDWLRVLKPHIERSNDAELSEAWRGLWVRVMGD